MATFFVLTIFTEIAFRIWFPQTSKSFEFDPIIGYRREPGKFISNVSGAYVVTKHVNTSGFTDDEWKIEKPAGTNRIAILGDSMTESIQVENDRDFESLLEKKLAERGNKVETMNFGLSGQNTAQEYLTFKHYAFRYKPDIAVVTVAITNDPSENHPKLNGRDYVPYILFDGDNERFIVPKDPSYGFPIDSLRSYSHFFRWVMSRTYDTEQALKKLWNRNGEQEKSGSTPVFFQNFLTKRDPSWEEAWTINRKLFKSIKNLTEELNMELVVIVIPDQTQVYDSLWNQKLEKAKSEFPELAIDESTVDREDPNKRYKAIFDSEKISYIDFLNLFRSKNAEELYALEDVHLNERGHEYVAETLATFLTEHRIKNLR